MKQAIVILLITSIVSAGCAHTTANPVQVAQPGDESRSCDGITNEMQQMLAVRATAESDRNNQIAGNVALGIAGAFLIVPWFFMDTGNAATVEERAAQARYQRLNQMQIDKKCPATPIQATAPSSLGSNSASVQRPTAPSGNAAPAPQPAPPAMIVAATLPTSPPSNAVARSPSKYMFNAERLAQSSGCVSPVATMNIASATSETFTIVCTTGEPISVRCDGANCRVLQ